MPGSVKEKNMGENYAYNISGCEWHSILNSSV